MAEAFPENVPDDPDDGKVDKREKNISVLTLATKWQFDAYGLSTVNKSLINNLRVVDPEAKKIKITCAVVEEDKNIKDDQIQDATKYKVKLRGGKQPRGAKKKPNIKWLDRNTGAYYMDLLRKDRYDFIIGHVPYLANGPLNLKDLYPEAEPKPKVILMIHELPKTTEGDSDEDTLLEWLSETDIVFSVGEAVESEIISCIASLDPEHEPIHKLYIPGFPTELFHVRRPAAEGNKVRGTQNVTLMTGDRKDLEISGLDFRLAVASASRASKHILEFDHVKTNFELLTNNKEDKEEWKKEFSELIQLEQSKGRSLFFQSDAPETFDKLKTHLRKSNLFILPLKPDSPLFGTEALSAVAAGVPILVSSHSGMAALLKTIAQDEPIVHESSLTSDEERWKDRIIQTIVRPEEANRTANSLREQLLQDTTIAHTHLDFTRIITETSCVRLEVELDSDSVVTEGQVDTAVKFGAHDGNRDTPIDTNKYVLDFLQKILLQRDKIDAGLLKDYLESGIADCGREVISVLENSNRKLLAVESGSIIFTLFCPTTSSIWQLTDDSWIETLRQKMENLLKKMGIEAQLRIHPPEDVALLSETEMLPSLPEINMQHTERSLVVAEMFPPMQSRVMEWLKRQSESEAKDTSGLTLLDRMRISHIEQGGGTSSLHTNFALSEASELIGIASPQAKPTLSVMYPDTDKPPLISPRQDGYTSALFITISGQEYLAAASVDQIHLWNLAKNTSSVVYKLKEEKDWHLCVIDERTVGCVAEQPALDGYSKIYALNTGAEKFNLSSALQVKAGRGITDIRFVKTTDGTPCVLLSFPWNFLVQLVEMVGGRVRWQVDKQQMGRSSGMRASFRPWSICTDGSTVFVLTARPTKLHGLSLEDGLVVMSINLHYFGIMYPSCVRLQGEYLYVGHMNENQDTFCVSKFTKPTMIQCKD